MLTDQYLHDRFISLLIRKLSFVVFFFVFHHSGWNQGMNQNIMEIDTNLCTKTTYTLKIVMLTYNSSHLIHSQYWAGEKEIKRCK